MMVVFRAAFLAALAATASSFVAPSRRLAPLSSRPMAKLDADVEAAVKKGGVEGGLFSIFKSDADGESKGASAKALLKEYGAAYVSTRVALDRPFSPRVRPIAARDEHFPGDRLVLDLLRAHRPGRRRRRAPRQGQHRRDLGDGEGHDRRHRLRDPQGREPDPSVAPRPARGARRPYGASTRRPRAGFPPTVALTPVVAKFLKQGNDGADDDRQGGSWAKYTDDATGATYWHNEKTGVSTWEKPE